MSKNRSHQVKKLIWISNLIWDYHLHKTTQIEVLDEFSNRGYEVFLIASYSRARECMENK